MTGNLRTSFDLYGETQGLVLHGFHVEVDRWDGRDHFAMLQLILLCWTSASVLGCFGTGWVQLSSVMCFSSYSRLVYVAVLRLALPPGGFALLPAVGFSLLPAVGFPLLGSF